MPTRLQESQHLKADIRNDFPCFPGEADASPVSLDGSKYAMTVSLVNISLSFSKED